MRCLLKTFHQQWLYRNATVHMALQNGLPQAKHKEILAQIEDCLGIDPGDLLEEDHVLLRVDFKRLATGSATEKLEWIVGMESAIEAADHIARGSRQALRTRYCRGRQPWMRLEYDAIQVNREGSIQWRRRRKRI